MSHLKMKFQTSISRLLPLLVVTVLLLLTTTAWAAVPGIKGATFNLTAQDGYISQPDGSAVYSWGYSCRPATNALAPTFAPFAGFCSPMQVPGPTLIVNENDTIVVTLTNNLPAAAGNTSILFPGFQVSTTVTQNNIAVQTGVQGLMTQEAVHGSTVTYTFVANKPGTHSYYSGTQSDLQVEMGLYGALIVLPKTVTGCSNSQGEYSLAIAAYDDLASKVNPSCYNREYLFQFAEMDARIHQQAEAIARCVPAAGMICATTMQSVTTEPYHPTYFLINGRSMPDDMDPNYATQYPNQPYNGNPHMHPGDLTLVRVIGTGRWQHPFHEHGNHVRLLARDGNLLLSATDASKLAGPLLFTTSTTPGQAFDGIYYWTGKGLNWDVYGHKPNDGSVCVPDASGYYTANSVPPAPLNALNYYEWCADHNRPLETNPYGSVGSGGPTTLPDANILADGAWYGGSPYLGPDATLRAVGNTPIPPAGTVVNPPGSEAGFAFMWHSHNEREITTNDIFPGGMLMMMLVDPPVFHIDETQ